MSVASQWPGKGGHHSNARVDDYNDDDNCNHNYNDDINDDDDEMNDDDDSDQEEMILNCDFRYSSPPKALRTLFSGFLGCL